VLGIAKDQAIEMLAECLYLKMERMDPNGRGEWSDLEEGDKAFYRESIRELVLEKTLLNIAIGN